MNQHLANFEITPFPVKDNCSSFSLSLFIIKRSFPEKRLQNSLSIGIKDDSIIKPNQLVNFFLGTSSSLTKEQFLLFSDVLEML